MTTVFKEMGIRIAEKGDIGLEIEVEGVNLPRLGKWWRNEQDGSLKGPENAEYVLQKPGSLEDIRAALNHLDSVYNQSSTVVHDTVRAGVHVHINCQNLTMTELYNFVTLYLCLENILVKWCGEYREGNLFCLRACDAEWMLSVLKLAASDKKRQFKNRLHRDELRYASMNLKALGDYGSLEFRSMRGTRDLNLIYTWAETLYGLREYAKTFEKPSDVVESFSLLGAEEFLSRALGKNTEHFLCEEYMDLLWTGVRNAQDVAYCIDWQKFEPKMKIVGGLEFPDDMVVINEPMEDF